MYLIFRMSSLIISIDQKRNDRINVQINVNNNLTCLRYIKEKFINVGMFNAFKKMAEMNNISPDHITIDNELIDVWNNSSSNGDFPKCALTLPTKQAPPPFPN